MEYLFFREHEPLPADSESPRWYGIRRALRFANRYGHSCFITSSFDHYTKQRKIIPDWLNNAGVRVILVPSFKYSHNKSIYRFINTFFYNLYSYFYLAMKRKSFAFFSGPSLGIFCFPSLLILKHNIHIELRDCWPLIARPSEQSVLTLLRFHVLNFFAFWAYKKCTKKFKIRCVSRGVYEYLFEIIKAPNHLLYRPFLAERCSLVRGKKNKDTALFVGTFENGFDECEFIRILGSPLSKTLNITIAGYGTKSDLVRQLCENLDNVTFKGKVTHSEVREMMRSSFYLLCFYPKNVGFEHHRTNKIMEAEAHDLTIISNMVLDTNLPMILI